MGEAKVTDLYDGEFSRFFLFVLGSLHEGIRDLHVTVDDAHVMGVLESLEDV